ncbi:DUF6326 family protein [Dyella lutea]|uniref:DUF6326 family protein n=1 Tax=Dyella lutea TaxID=2950441 RepID=A0ABT1FCF2_9GAMM|nr:DUF6326 family protein [Dyella lutea]MCP1374810.1 DUF6326 family protein [Dyella lutea]
MDGTTRQSLEHWRAPVQLKLAALWTSVMFCYIYGDYFGLFVPGTLKAMFNGQMGSLGPTTQGVLLGTAALVTFPALMVFLSLALRPAINRPLNILLGLAYTVIVILFMPGGWLFYEVMAVVEIILQLLVVWYAWHWPRGTMSS